MKEVEAVIGGEGNGGIIYPASHYGRDALAGIALFLSQMAKSGKKPTELRSSYPSYYMSKQKIELTPELNINAILDKIKDRFLDQNPIDIDGVKIDFPDKWVHLRKSNTENIIRIYSEANSLEEADELGKHFIDLIKELA